MRKTPANMYVVFDIETRRGPEEVEGGWRNPEGMGFGLAVAYDGRSDQYLFFDGDHAEPLRVLLQTVPRIVTFNGLRFDYRVLFGNNYALLDVSPHAEHIDLLDIVCRAKFEGLGVHDAELKFGQETIHDGTIGLDGLARGTFGLQKTGHGAKAPRLIASGDWAAVYAYCLNDVRLTRKLYEQMIWEGFVVDGGGHRINIPTPRGQENEA